MANTLYVFFHGLISLIEYEKRFRAILINMPDHREALGHWLTERSIPQGVSLTLNGVTAANGSLDPANNIILDGAAVDQVSLCRFRYADIYLPKPDRVLSIWSGEAAAHLTGTTARSTSTNYSALQVFQYAVPADFNLVSLTGSNFEFDCAGQTTLPNGDQVATIHILNEPETSASEAHATEEFARGAMILGSDLRLSAALPFPGANPPGAMTGLLREEFLPLGDRERAVLPMLDVLRVNAARGGGAVGTGRFCGTCHARVR